MGSSVLEKAKEQFGTKMSVDTYKELKKSIEAHTLNGYDNKFYGKSKNGNTLLVYSGYNDSEYFGYFDIFRLKENLSELRKDKSFQKFSFSFITPLKIWSKKRGLKIHKPLIDIILKYAYQNYDFDHESSRGTHTYVSNTLQKYFSTYHCSSLFVDDQENDDQENIVINFKDENKNNIIYAQTKDCAHRLIVPEKIHNGEYLRVNSEICKPGEIEINGLQKNKQIFTLKVTKDDTEYAIEL